MSMKYTTSQFIQWEQDGPRVVPGSVEGWPVSDEWLQGIIDTVYANALAEAQQKIDTVFSEMTGVTDD